VKTVVISDNGSLFKIVASDYRFVVSGGTTIR
jgi:hypothetical protein